jgi:hypothetical protein
MTVLTGSSVQKENSKKKHLYVNLLNSDFQKISQKYSSLLFTDFL